MTSRDAGRTVLISGGCGFAGRHLAARLAPECSRIHLMDKTGFLPGSLKRFEDRITVHQVDLTAPRGLARLLDQIRPGEIYHLAGIANVKNSWDGEALTFRVNVIGAVNLVSAIRHANLPSDLLVVGSGEVYGDVPETRQPLDEDQPVSPRSPYAASKVCQEIAVRQMARHISGRVIFVRPFNHIGPGQHPSFVAPDFARQIAHIEHDLQAPVIRVGNLSSRRDFTDVRDTVDAYVRVLRAGKDREIYNVCSGRTLPIQTILDRLLERSRVDIRVIVDPDKFRPADVPVLCGNPEKLSRDTGWKPVRPIVDTLAEVLDDWRNQVSAA